MTIRGARSCRSSQADSDRQGPGGGRNTHARASMDRSVILLERAYRRVEKCVVHLPWRNLSEGLYNTEEAMTEVNLRINRRRVGCHPRTESPARTGCVRN